MIQCEEGVWLARFPIVGFPQDDFNRIEVLAVEFADADGIERIAIADADQVAFAKIGIILLNLEMENALLTNAFEGKLSNAASGLNAIGNWLSPLAMVIVLLCLAFLMDKSAELGL